MSIKQKIEQSIIVCLKGKYKEDVIGVGQENLKKYWGIEGIDISNNNSICEKTCLSDISNVLDKEFKDITTKKRTFFLRIFSCKVKKLIGYFEDVIDVCLTVNAAFIKLELDETEPLAKEELQNYIDASRIHIDTLQNQCNRLIFRKQRYEFKISLIIAITSIIIAVFSAIYTNCLTQHQNDSNLQQNVINSQRHEEIIKNINKSNIQQTQSNNIQFQVLQDSINKLIKQNDKAPDNRNKKDE
jgi:hypothetical protein